MRNTIYSAVALAITLLSSSANGHMTMKTPTPYGKSSLNNSPLAADGSDFPCKQRPGVYDAEGASNTMAIGEPQTLSFTGSAVHGGGSCQVSFTKDKEPTANSVWMVIHSIEGGCPAGVEGNLPEDPNGGGASTFEFKVPDGIEPGDYSMAWTWFNRIGNREMYMNCAPVTVTGGGSKKRSEDISLAKRADFPDMFKANLGDGCSTTEGTNLQFPNPGQSVEKAPGAPLGPPSGSCAAGGGSTGGGSGGDDSTGGDTASSSTSAVPTPTSSAVSTPTSAAPSEPATGGGFQQLPTTSAVATPVPSGTAPGGSPDSSTGDSTGGGGLTGPCTSEGMWNCIGGSSFQRCASGQWSAVTPMSGGTKCTPGQATDLAMSKAKRDVRFSEPHLRRHRARAIEGSSWPL